MDEFAFLTLTMLINHRVPHILVEIYEYRFLGKNECPSHPLIQGAKACPITSQVQQTDLFPAHAPTRGTRAHLPVTHP